MQRNSGMTLIETTLYLSIATILIAVLMNAGIDLQRAAQRSDEQHVRNTELMLITTKFRSIAQQALSVTIPSTGERADVVSFSMYEAARDPTLFFVENGVLWIQEGQSEPSALHGSDNTAEAVFILLDQAQGVHSLHASMTLRASSSMSIGSERSTTLSTAVTLPL